MGSPPSSGRLRTGEATGRLLVVGAALLWGTTGTAQALGPPGVSPTAVGVARIVLGGGVLFLLALARGGLAAGRPWPPAQVAVASLSVAAYQPLFFWAVRSTGVAVGTVVAIGSAPVVAGGLAYLLRGERPGRRWAMATLLAVTGALLLFLVPGHLGVRPMGVLLALGAGTAYALYALASKDLLEGRPPGAVMGLVFGLAGLVLLPTLPLVDSAALGTGRGVIMVLHLGLVATAVAYLLFARGLAVLPVATVATLSLAEPLTAALLGLVLLSEPLTVPRSAGMLLVLGGLILLARPSSGHTEARP